MVKESEFEANAPVRQPLMRGRDNLGMIGEAKIILERLRRTIQSLDIPFESEMLHITVSVGATTSKHGMQDQNELIMAADKQLYRAKDLGRNRVECWFE